MQEVKPETLDYRILLAFLKVLPNQSLQREIKPGKLKDILGISHSTLNSALERMENEGLLKWKHYGSIILEKKGENALQHVEHHQHLIELYLKMTLNLTDNEAEEESFKLAPHFSCKLIEKLIHKYPNCALHDQHEPYAKLCDN